MLMAVSEAIGMLKGSEELRANFSSDVQAGLIHTQKFIKSELERG